MTSTRPSQNRDRKLPTVSYSLRPEQLEGLRQVAMERGVSQSTVLRDAIDRLFVQIVEDALDELTRAQAQHHLPLPPTPDTETRTPAPRPAHQEP